MPTPPQEYREIALTQGQFTIVNAADFDWLSQWKWQADWGGRVKGFYARRVDYFPGRKRVSIRMHRLILGLSPEDKRQCDHINHNTLDNRRTNLRIVTAAQNGCNKKKHVLNATGFKGVRPHGKRFQAFIRHNRKLIALGTRDTPEEAHSLYREAALRLHGEFASF